MSTTLTGSARRLAYWRAALDDDLSPIELPYDGRHPSTASFAASSVAVRVPSALANAVRGVARAHGATMFMTLLAAWQAVLHVYSRQDNVSVGAPIAGRGRSEFDETVAVGVFVNTLVLRALWRRGAGAAVVGALLEQVKRAVLGAFDNQDVPFEPERDERRNPLFQVFFDVSNAETATVSAGVGGGAADAAGTALGSARWGELAVEMHEPPTHSTQFELALSLAGERDGSLAGELEYASAARRDARLAAGAAGGANADGVRGARRRDAGDICGAGGATRDGGACNWQWWRRQ